LIAIGSAAPQLWGGQVLAAPKAVLVDEYAKPTPYEFGYDVQDEYGTQLTRQESGDGNGAVKGSYSYKDAQGLTRVVEYVADGHGFRAVVKTNEPGTEPKNPADVEMLSNPIIVKEQLVARPILQQKLY